ncbi:hypothetical protein BCR36DRAFT_366540 [Piromyces finnis]|uniref:Sm protein B n=1 Tax=Piromyces finnis TaxID=1754191 RepID=A0A1Y1VLN4_9FUNG|nr:hypothetical protein BCR36DRAFT_366540 [Piromyces finnis]|eukprot:ORX59352.1 hypothetical protein BCR36DRAFT_366540 [Piromyces finnis]
MTLTKKSRMATIINSRIKVTIQDSRTFVGQMLAFDKYMNLVLADCEEFRKIKSKGKANANQGDREEKRALGLVILRGEIIVNLSVVAPPPAKAPKPKTTINVQTPGISRPAGRGISAAASLAGPVRGLGGPAQQIMQPMGMVPPQGAFGRGVQPQPGAPSIIRPPMYRPQAQGMPPMNMPPQGFRPQMRPPQMGVPPQFGVGRGTFPMPQNPAAFRPRPAK